MEVIALPNVHLASVAQSLPVNQYPFDLVSAIVLLAIEMSNDLSIAEFILMRNRFRLICPELVEFVDARSIFWTRLAFTSRSPLPFIQRCIERSQTAHIFVSFRASDPGVDPCYSYDGEPCSLLDYVEDAAHCLGYEMERCVQLAVSVDDPMLAEVVFDSIDWAEPKHLEVADITFEIQRYIDFLPNGLRHFSFSSYPPMGQPFRPFTDLSWVGSSLGSPVVSYHVDDTSTTCSILHPRTEYLSWSDILDVVSASTHLDQLMLSGLAFPLETLTLHMEFPSDIDGLYVCGTILSSDLHAFPQRNLLGSGITRISVCGVGFASNKRADPSLINWYACPQLQRLTVQDVSLASVRDLVVVRANSGYPELHSVYVIHPIGGHDGVIELWFGSRGIHLHVD
ncbi:hypothetical protein B0H16DRAFT_1712859 [Mycena metata]|uniref:Uncharacterized protein n=1 Tax=Mycena metata TaxID=1033252 RepID=A0AAD7NU90_9AGAR|nr:hypothetical protein B0H16DRAFT_1712859 [Mycena metata]